MDEGAAFDALDEEIAELEAERATCRRAIALSRAAILAGSLTFVLSIPLVALRAPTVAFGAFAAIVGGVVWAGASKTSGDEIDARIAAAETRKAALFDVIAARNGWRDITPTVH